MGGGQTHHLSAFISFLDYRKYEERSSRRLSGDPLSVHSRCANCEYRRRLRSGLFCCQTAHSSSAAVRTGAKFGLC
jgi:hypothetical protein